MNCPCCENPGCEELAEEVDIGVGIQRFVVGFECPACGQIPVCSTCGGIGDEHAKWCEGIKEIHLTPDGPVS